MYFCLLFRLCPISTRVSLLKKAYAVTTETTKILEYSNFAINQLISYISSITNFVHSIDTQNFVLGLLGNLAHFIHHKFCTFHRYPKFCAWLTEQFRTFHPSLHESVTLLFLHDNVVEECELF